IQASIFNQYIKHLDNQMRLAGWSILLLMDGASTHRLEKGYTPTNIKLHILSLNTTAHLQPCDTRIIWKSGEPPEPLNIKDVIDFTATAWKKNSSLTNESDLMDEIQNLIGQLPLDQPMSAYQYIIANNDLIATKIPTDEEIIESVKNHECIELEDESPKKLISFVQALEFIKGISSFFEQQPDSNFKVEDSFIRGLRQLKKEVNFKHIASKQQATLDTFIHSTN
ncbi:5417_t:CDS:2, partial [Dentiscutata heterogama]